MPGGYQAAAFLRAKDNLRYGASKIDHEGWYQAKDNGRAGHIRLYAFVKILQEAIPSDSAGSAELSWEGLEMIPVNVIFIDCILSFACGSRHVVLVVMKPFLEARRSEAW